MAALGLGLCCTHRYQQPPCQVPVTSLKTNGVPCSVFISPVNPHAATLHAVTIARITENTARALQRPEVKAKLDAWNQSRVGSKMSDDIKVCWVCARGRGRGTRGLSGGWLVSPG